MQMNKKTILKIRLISNSYRCSVCNSSGNSIFLIFDKVFRIRAIRNGAAKSCPINRHGEKIRLNRLVSIDGADALCILCSKCGHHKKVIMPNISA